MMHPHHPDCRILHKDWLAGAYQCVRAEAPTNGTFFSELARTRLRKGFLATYRMRTWLALWNARPGGLTDFEIEEAIGAQRNTARPRRIELRDFGLVVGTGRERLSPGGSRCEVWRAVHPAEVILTYECVEGCPHFNHTPDRWWSVDPRDVCLDTDWTVIAVRDIRGLVWGAWVGAGGLAFQASRERVEWDPRWRWAPLP